jgi:hypothetical protein
MRGVCVEEFKISQKWSTMGMYMIYGTDTPQWVVYAILNFTALLASIESVNME